jgi:hypothetical protein
MDKKLVSAANEGSTQKVTELLQDISENEVFGLV